MSHITTLKVNLSHYNPQSQSLTVQLSKSQSLIIVQLSKSISHSTTLKVNLSQWNSQSQKSQSLTVNLSKWNSHTQSTPQVSQKVHGKCLKRDWKELPKASLAKMEFLKRSVSQSETLSQSVSFINLCRQKMIFLGHIEHPNFDAVWSQFGRSLIEIYPKPNKLIDRK